MIKKNYTLIDNFIKKSQPPISKPKEAEPASPKSEKIEFKETVEHKLEKQVTPYVQVRKETIELPPDLKKMGLQSSSSTNFPSYQTVVLPISDDKVYQGLHAPISSSLRWLATLAIYLLRKAHLTLKVIHGHVIRVMRR
jgi:hypothetical protein